MEEWSEACKTCGEVCHSGDKIICMDCSAAFHRSCTLWPLPEPSPSTTTHSPSLTCQQPWRCPSCIRCSLCTATPVTHPKMGKNYIERRFNTCCGCRQSFCGACLRNPCGRGFAWNCGAGVCARCMWCGKARIKADGIHGCKRCTRQYKERVCRNCQRIVADAETPWITDKSLLGIECAKCRKWTHHLCKSSSESYICAKCTFTIQIRHAPAPPGITWFWDLDNESLRIPYASVNDPDGRRIKIFRQTGDIVTLIEDDFKRLWEARFSKSTNIFINKCYSAILKRILDAEKVSQSAELMKPPSMVRPNDLKEISLVGHDSGCFRLNPFSSVNPFKPDLNPQNRLKGFDRLPNPPTVYVARSAIAGWGLFAAHTLAPGGAIIEYRGEIIGRALSDHRERRNNDHPVRRHACYMFARDEDSVIDATFLGNSARFINHSCQPNCTAKIVSGRIVISAKEAIKKDAELFYDYKFSADSMGNRMPCECGAVKCRKFI